MDGWIKIGTKLDTKDFDKQIEEVEYELEQVNYELSKKKELKLDDRTIREYQSKAEKLTNKIIDLKKKQEDLNNTNLRDVQKSIDNIGDGTSKTIKKVGKWALAVFGVRSAYMFVRNSIGILSQYNEQLATDIEYIKFALASSLEPVITRLVSFVFKLLRYINAVAKALFNVDLFANATQEAFGKTNKEANKLKKTLAGFDEMNIVGDTSGGASGGISPSDFLGENNGQEVEEIKSFWAGIRKFWEEDFVQMIENLTGIWASFIQGLGMIAYGIYTTLKGLWQVISGLFQLIFGLLVDDSELVEKAWDKMCEGIKNIFLGLLEIIGGALLTALGFIKGIFLEFVGAIYNIVIKPIADFFVMLWNGVVSGVKVAVQWLKDAFNSVVGFFKNIINTIVGLFKTIGTKVGDVLGSAFKAVINGVLRAIENILNFPINSINKLINVINKIPGINLGTLPTFNLPRLAVGGIVNMPGRGVPVGSAIAGEAGAEGVIPLTDSQAMETLGQAIGRYITINANITNTMNGRVISRELQKVNSSSDFAFNR